MHLLYSPGTEGVLKEQTRFAQKQLMAQIIATHVHSDQ